MSDKHVFSTTYCNRKEAVLNALKQEEAIEKSREQYGISTITLKVFVIIAGLVAVAVTIYIGIK